MDKMLAFCQKRRMRLQEGACLRSSHDRSEGQCALMRQLKAGKRNSSAEVPSGHKNDPHESVYRQLFGGTNSFAL